MTPASGPLLRTHPSFRYFLLCRMSATLLLQMLMVIVAWQMYDLTHRAYDLGLVGLAQFIPSLALCLLVGQVADRHDRRRILMACMVLQCVIAVLLIAATHGGWLDRSVLLLASVGLGIARAFQMPTQQALLPMLVPQSLLPRALALNAAGTQFATITGPAAGGFLYVAGASTVYGCCVGMGMFATLMLGLIRYERAIPRREQVTLQSLFAGISFIWRRKEVLGAISLDLFAVLFGGATALLPVFARDVLHTGSWGLGLLRSAPAIGALVVSLYLARHPLQRRVGKLMFFSVAMYGASTMIFALSGSFAVALAALVLSGAFDMVSVVVRQSLVQLETPDGMRGRVSAVNSIFVGASNQLGEFESGVTASWLGAPASVLLGGAATVAIVVLWMRLFPALTQRQRLTTA